MLSYLHPTSKVLQESTLVMPKLITICASAVANIKKLKKYVEENGSHVFSAFLEELTNEESTSQE